MSTVAVAGRLDTRMDPGVVERAWVFGEEVRGTGSGLRALPILVVLSRRVGVDFELVAQGLPVGVVRQPG